MRQHEQENQPEVIRSEPVPVPPPADAGHEGRGGRPEDRSGPTDVPEDALDDRGTFDDPTVAGERHRGDAGQIRPYDLRRDEAGTEATGRTEVQEPAPLPTAFGATTVGGAVAASAMAGGRPQDEVDPREERTALPGDGAPGRTDRLDDERADPTAADRLHDPDRWAAEHSGRATGHGGVSALRDRDESLTAGAAGYGRAEPAMVDPDATPGGGAAALTAAGTTAAGTPGTTIAAEPATLFDPGTAQGFRDRWRDVQLRFVDDPREAAGEAQRLVEEAIQALAAALAAQKNTLGGWQDAGSADTEQLRQAVRRYRDFLDRVLGR